MVAREALCLAGTYHGSAPEIAVQLDLGEDGRFAYRLVYGALDEAAQGQWTYRDGAVRLTSEPVTAPELALEGRSASDDRLLRVALELPNGFSRQYFDAVLHFADGRKVWHQFEEEGLAITGADYLDAESLRVVLPLFGIESAPVPSPRAEVIRFRFTPNDLGKVPFDDFALPLDDRSLRLARHHRDVELRLDQGGCQAH